jgi:hypothetical protein
MSPTSYAGLRNQEGAFVSQGRRLRSREGNLGTALPNHDSIPDGIEQASVYKWQLVFGQEMARI